MKFLAHLILAVLLCLAGGLAGSAQLLRLHRPEMPPEYRREASAALLAWNVVLPTSDGTCASLGPLTVGNDEMDVSVLESALGLPDVYDERCGPHGFSSYYGLGLQLQIVWSPRDYASLKPLHAAVKGILRPGILPPGKFSLTRIVLGNPRAKSAEDPLVQACPFLVQGKFRLGTSRAALWSDLPQQWKFAIYERYQGCQFYFVDERLVGIEITPCSPWPTESTTSSGPVAAQHPGARRRDAAKPTGLTVPVLPVGR